MAVPVLQPSFASGEFAPSLYARVDLAKYHQGVALARNFQVDYRGGLSNRAGTRFIGKALATGSGIVRLFSFTFSTIQTYILEFGYHYIRVIANGAYVLEATTPITGITQSTPGVITDVGHGYATGDWITILNVKGMPQLNGKTFVINKISADTYSLVDMWGAPVDTSGYTAYISGGTARRIYTITTTYADTDLALLKFTQSADTLTLTHPKYAPASLTRTGNAAWTLTNITFASVVSTPAGGTTVPSTAGTTTYSYVVTAIDANGRESLPSAAITTALSATMSATANAYNTVSGWGAVTGAASYNVYRQVEIPGGAASSGSLFGFVGNTSNTSFVDHNTLPDFSQSPPIGYNPFAANNNPGCTTYYQGRQAFAASTSGPENMWLSKTDDFANMDYSNPPQADDALQFTLASLQVNAIQFMVPMTSLIVLTTGGAWKVDGGAQSAMTPTNISAIPQAYNGCSPSVPPLTINYDILYVQAKGAIVRDLSYNFYINVFTGADITVLANHLFFGHQIKEWCWAEEPYKTVWAVREDGILLALAYLKEQDIYGWTRHDTAGAFMSTASVAEGQEDAIYFVVKRYINSQWVQYIERMASRNFGGKIIGQPNPPWFLDAALAYPLMYLAATLTVQVPPPPAFLFGAGIVMTTDVGVFDGTMVGSRIQVNNGSGVITSVNNGRSVIVNVDVPMDNTNPAAPNAWSCTAPVQVVSGLDHLNGTSVGVFADGGVQAPQTVVNGSITLQNAATQIVVGVPYTAQMQTLYIDQQGEQPTPQGRRKTVHSLTMRVTSARGLKAGYDFGHLSIMKDRQTTQYSVAAPVGQGNPNPATIIYNLTMGMPIPLITGDVRINIQSKWQVEGQVCVEIDDPLPCTILGIMPEITMGDTQSGQA